MTSLFDIKGPQPQYAVVSPLPLAPMSIKSKTKADDENFNETIYVDDIACNFLFFLIYFFSNQKIK